MNFNLTREHADRAWSSTIGLKAEQFYKLLEQFEKSYFKIQGSSLKSRLINEKAKYCINSEEELLFFTLFSLKSGLTYDVLGVISGMDGSHAKRTQKLGLRILTHTLCSLSHMPMRKFDKTTDFNEYFSDIDVLIVDATEHEIQRPTDKDTQKEYYSGKKKTYKKDTSYM